MQNEQRLSTQSLYTSRERVLEALHHKETDRIPIDFGGMASTGIMAIAYARLKEYLGITGGQIRVFDMGQQLAKVELKILTRSMCGRWASFYSSAYHTETWSSVFSYLISCPPVTLIAWPVI
jgi:hypothetical protein